MTQEEVDLIYTYLHENYRYGDGDFYKKSTGNILRGSLQNRMPPCYVIRLSINKKQQKTIKMAHAVFIFFNKRRAPYIKFKDNNFMNYKIENLLECSKEIIENYGKKSNELGYRCIEKVGNKFCARITINKKRIRTPYFTTPEEAHAAYLKAKEKYAQNP